MFQRELNFFKQHKAELARQYPGKEVVIVGEQVVGAYDTASEANRETLKLYSPGQFIIRRPDEPGFKRPSSDIGD
jgi:hypothetical protein